MRKDDIPAELVRIVVIFGLDLHTQVPHELFFAWRKMQRLVSLIIEETVFVDLCTQRMPIEKILMDEDKKTVFVKLQVLELDNLPRLHKGHASIIVIVFCSSV